MPLRSQTGGAAIKIFSPEKVIPGFLQTAKEQDKVITKSASAFIQNNRVIYENLKVTISFGQGNAAAVPWIAFTGYNQTLQNGIYPVYLYYKSRNKLILAYGLSDTNSPKDHWPNTDRLETIETYFKQRGEPPPERYGSSIVHSVYNATQSLDFLKMERDLKQVINEFHALFTSSVNQVKEFEQPYLRKKRVKPEQGNNRAYWWLNANPKIWRINEFELYQEQNYTSFNATGKKRRIYEYFEQVKSGDLVIGYATSPIKKVIALFEITEKLHYGEEEGQELISFKIIEFFPNQIDWTELTKMEELVRSEVLKNNQGSLFKLTEAEYTSVVSRARNVQANKRYEEYDMDKALEELFIGKTKIDSILNALSHKRNIILQGPPGTGKTFLAKRIAYLKLGQKNPARVEIIQFHQSYAYEDFIQGYRPNGQGQFEVKNGPFYEFCLRAQRDPGNDYFFIIDEINRGNLSKIFGELMMLMENDKRGPEFAIPLTYSRDISHKFYIPVNLHLIGTMNTADRSLAMVDYALRRRFAFITINPEFDSSFIQYLINKKAPEKLAQKISDNIKEINRVIRQDRNLGAGFAIGHSYFCNSPSDYDDDWYKRVIEHEIAPLLYAYWFDAEDKADEHIQNLLG